MTEFSASSFELIPTGICPSCRSARPARPTYCLPFFNVFDCEVCGLRFIDPSLTDEEQMRIYQSQDTIQSVNSALASYYDYDALNPKTRTYRDYDTALEKAGATVAHRSLCEIGCGAGSFLKLAQSRGWTVAGIDSSHENVKKLQASGIPAIQGNIFEKDDWPQFDCVALWDVIEHPRDPGHLLSRCRKLLKPGGVLLIATPCYPNLISRIAGMISRLSAGKIRGPLEKMYMFEHIAYFSKNSLAHLLRRGGFEMTDVWKTETDLKRYSFSPAIRPVLNGMFFFARLFSMQNRIITIARAL